MEKHLASQTGAACSPGQWAPAAPGGWGPADSIPLRPCKQQAFGSAPPSPVDDCFSHCSGVLFLPHHVCWASFPRKNPHPAAERLDRRPVVMVGACLGRAAPLPLTVLLGFGGQEKGRERIFIEHLLCARYCGPFPRSYFPSLLTKPTLNSGYQPRLKDKEAQNKLPRLCSQ